jgi:hypothetical protein
MSTFVRSPPVLTFRSIQHQDGDDHTIYTAYHRGSRRVYGKFHIRHGKELFPRVLLRQTRFETLATRPGEGAFPIIPGHLHVHSSGFHIFDLIHSFTEALFFVLENSSARHRATIYAQENRERNGCCESRDRTKTSTTG